jgi:hypothetical protein
MSNISPSIKAFDKIVSLSPGAGRKRLWKQQSNKL